MFSRKMRHTRFGEAAFGQIVPDQQGYLVDERREALYYQGFIRWHYVLYPHHETGNPGEVKNIYDNLYFHIQIKCLDNSE